MPRRLRTSKARALSTNDRCALTVGGFVADDEDRSRELWVQFRDELVRSCRAGRRPWAWWRWDVGERHVCIDPRSLSADREVTYTSWVPDCQEVWLAERGLLEPDEVAAFVEQLGWERGGFAAFARRVLDAHARGTGNGAGRAAS